MTTSDTCGFTEGRLTLDCTGKLPDELLVKFLSGLPLKEAVRTCVLSRRWTDLWKSAELVLDFDSMDELIAIYRIRNWETRGSGLAEKRLWYKNWVNRVVSQLQRHDSSRVIKFRVAFSLTDGCNSEGDIDRWLKFAISKRVESLHLAFHVNIVGNADKYVFSEDCYNHIKTPAGLSDIKPLRSLFLSYVHIRDEVLDHIIANCPSLEELVLKQSNSLTKLRVVGLALKHLEVQTCERLKSMELVQTPRLARFIYSQYRAKELRVGNCPSLVHLNLGISEPSLSSSMFESFAGCASRFESLFLKISHMKMPLSGVAEHTCLERLTVEVYGTDRDTIFGLIPLINQCPRLHTLQLCFYTVYSSDRRRYPSLPVPDVAKIGRESIKVVEIAGFGGYERDSEFVEYMMECFVGLERIVIDRGYSSSSFCDNSIFPGESMKLCSEEQSRRAEKLALEFKSKAPQTLQFVVR